MLKPETIKREMRRLQQISDDLRAHEVTRRQALAMINTLRWVLGGCKWRPSGIVGLASWSSPC